MKLSLQAIVLIQRLRSANPRISFFKLETVNLFLISYYNMNVYLNRRVRREDMRSMETGYERLITIERSPWFSGRETKRRRRRRRRISEPEIPNDVMEEIMLRLPVPSVMRFQILSKHWKSLIRSREFGERYMAYQKKGKVPKLFCVNSSFNDRGESFFIIERMALERASASLEDKQYLRVKNFKALVEVSESCDGIVCIYGLTNAVRVVNAAMSTISEELRLAKIQRIYIDHPDPELVEDVGKTFTRFGFGKDSVTGRYKLVWLYNRYPITSTSLTCKKKTRCEVLDLEDKIWRFVSTRPLDYHHILYNQRPAFANGSFYWLTGDEDEWLTGDAVEQGYQAAPTKLIVFDIHTEMFQLIPTPPFITSHAFPEDIGLCNLHGRLCVSELNGDCTQDFWWRVQDKDDTWEKIFSVDLRSTSTWFRGINWVPLTPLAILRDNNKVILSLTYQPNLVAFDLDTSLYHLYYSGFYGDVVPYFPSTSII